MYSENQALMLGITFAVWFLGGTLFWRAATVSGANAHLCGVVLLGCISKVCGCDTMLRWIF